MAEPSPFQRNKSRTLTLFLLIILLLLFSIWLLLTPTGVDGKVRAIGYAVCHQIESHSLTIGGKILPLCARCTGMFLGLLISISYLLSRERVGGTPSKLIIAVLSLFCAFFVIDGLNSSLTLLPNVTPVYQPNNLLRLFSGLLFGIALANLVLPLWNQTLWIDWQKIPIIKTWRRFVILICLVLVSGLLILLDIPFLFYPVAILSTTAIFIVLGMIYSLLWCIILKKENSLNQYRDGIRIFSIGLITAILQIGLMDLARYTLTQTW